MKSPLRKSASFFLALLIILCHSCAPTEQVPHDTAAKPTAKAPPELPDVVAKISDYFITRKQLEERLRAEVYRAYDVYSGQAHPVDTKAVLRKMIAEKAMIMEGRTLNLLEDKIVYKPIKRFKEDKLVDLLLSTYLKGKITVTEAEIDKLIKAKPKLDRRRAKAALQRAKRRKLVNQFYDGIYKKLRVRKFTHNFPRVVRIHYRLYLDSARRHEMAFIRVTEIDDDLTPEERDMPLAIYNGGIITLKDWLETLCQNSPPSRPRDLHTIEGVERLLDTALRIPLWVAEAKARGLDKDQKYLKQVKKEEDKWLFRYVRRKKFDEIKQKITEEQLIDYFNKNKEKFATPRKLSIDQIWCQDLETAQKAKTELDSGQDFQSVKEKYSFTKKQTLTSITPGREGIFFEDLWKGDPNDIVGPVKGPSRGGVKWRIVKILEKKPAIMREYSSKMKNKVKNTLRNERREAVLTEYGKELLEKYPYQIYAERIADIHPYNLL